MTTILILSIIGIVVILAEIVLPGGILGIVGGICLVAAVVITFVEYGTTAGIIALAILVVFSIATLSWWMKFFHRLPLTRSLILKSESGHREEKGDEPSPIGSQGIALTDLMPSGYALIDDEKRDVMAESQSISKDALIEVVEVHGPSLIVKEVEKAAGE
jgi:membrane-bound serine protease (ClpP class)